MRYEPRRLNGALERVRAGLKCRRGLVRPDLGLDDAAIALVHGAESGDGASLQARVPDVELASDASLCGRGLTRSSPCLGDGLLDRRRIGDREGRSDDTGALDDDDCGCRKNSCLCDET